MNNKAKEIQIPNLTNFIPSKKMGQNFLINNDICEKIVDLIDYSKYDVVIEVGPGLGAITSILIEKSNLPVIAIELDKRLFDYTKKKHKDAKNFTIINNDILDTNMDEIIGEYRNPVIISNLPYSISSLVVAKFIRVEKITTMYFMVQKEMGERITALPNTKEYNAFSALLNYYAKTKRLLKVSPNNFNPKPEVDSIVIEISKISDREFDLQFEKFLKLSFMQKRKTFINNLKNIYKTEDILKVLKKFKISELVRAEALDSVLLHKIYKELNK